MNRIIFSIITLFLLVIPAYSDNDSGILPVKLLEAYRTNAINNYLIVDIRDNKRYEESRIPGAINIPLVILQEARELSHSDKDIIIYSESDKKSKEGVEILKERGLHTFYLMGGLDGWQNAGGEIKRGAIYQEGMPKRFTIPRGLCEPLEPAKVYGEDD